MGFFRDHKAAAGDAKPVQDGRSTPDHDGSSMLMTDGLRCTILNADKLLDRHEQSAASAHKRQIGLLSASFLIFNRMIGTGIFATPSGILELSGSVGLSLFLWVAGMLIAAAGMAVYLEFGTAMPKNGSSTRCARDPDIETDQMTQEAKRTTSNTSSISRSTSQPDSTPVMYCCWAGQAPILSCSGSTSSMQPRSKSIDGTSEASVLLV